MSPSRPCLLACVIFTSLLSAAQIKFTSKGLPTASNANWIVTGDFNRDGYPDIAVSEQSSVEVYLSNGSGGYTLKATLPAASPTQVETADVNHDGKLDLIVTSNTNSGIMIFRGVGDGTFLPSASIPTGLPVYEVAPASLVTPAIADLVTRECDISSPPVKCSIRVYRNNGSGGYSSAGNVINASTHLNANAYRGLVLADLNGDGRTDLTVARQDGFDVFAGKGNGTFAAPTHYAVTGGVLSLAVGSLRNNSWLDLIVGAFHPCNSDPCQYYAEAYLNNGAGKFALKSKNLIYGQFLATSDLDGDGYPEIVGVNGDHFFGDLQYLRGHGNGYFDAGVSVASPDTGFVPVPRDMTLDGRHDLLYSELLPADVKILKNTNTPIPCPSPPSSKLQATFGLSANAAGDITLLGAANSPAGVVRIEFWLDGKKTTETWNDEIVVHFHAAKGTHHLVLIAVDKYGATQKFGRYLDLP